MGMGSLLPPPHPLLCLLLLPSLSLVVITIHCTSNSPWCPMHGRWTYTGIKCVRIPLAEASSTKPSFHP